MPFAIVAPGCLEYAEAETTNPARGRVPVLPATLTTTKPESACHQYRYKCPHLTTRTQRLRNRCEYLQVIG
jgi:hypothetical protein